MSTANKTRSWFRGLLVLTLVIVASLIAAYWYATLRYQRQLFRMHDVFVALVFYLESHHGNFPETETAFAASSFIERLPDGAILVTAVPDSKEASKVYGEPISNLADYAIAYGVDISAMTATEDGRVVDRRKGEEILLLRSPFGLKDSRVFSVALLRVAERVRQCEGIGMPERAVSRPVE